MANTPASLQGTMPGSKRVNPSKLACRLPQLNSLWSVWYCTVTFSLQVYLVVSNIRLFSSYTILPWPVGTQPYNELNMYVASMGLAVVLLPCFVLTALLKVGNYPNDGTKLEDSEGETVVYQNLQRRRFYHGLKVVWRHSGPTAAFLHMTIAFSLLFPRLFIQAQLIKHGFLSKVHLWRTDVDFLIPPQERIVSVTSLSRLNVTDVLIRHRNETATAPLSTVHHLDEETTLSVEFLNYTFSLLVYAVRYPSVFWKSSRWFALLFSFQMVLNTVHILLVYAGFCILYKVHVYGAENALMDCTQLLLNVPLSVALFLGYTCLLVTSGCVVYSYGVQKHRGWQGRRMAGLLLLYSLLLVALIVLPVVPLMYDYASVYCGSLDGLMLASLFGAIIHLSVWILLWLILTLRTSCLALRRREEQINRFVPGDSSNYKPGKETPLFVIKGGQTYQVRERASKKAILQIVQRSGERGRCTSPDSDDVYWLRPKMSTHEETKTREGGGALFRKHSGTKGRLASGLSPKLAAKFKKQNVKFENLSDTSDDGDYAILRDLVTDVDEQVNQEKESKGIVGEIPPTNDTATATVHDGDNEGIAAHSESYSSDHSNSDSSSGVHSPTNNISKRASSMENLTTFDPTKPVWKSMSLQRNAPTGCRGEVYYSDHQATLVIHRKFQSTKADEATNPEEPFGRATNMKMISFTDRPEYPKVSPPSPEDSVKDVKVSDTKPGTVNLTVNPGHQRRDSANYSLTSSGDSDVAHS